MKTYSFNELIELDENEIISVSKNAIHIQIIKYDNYYGRTQKNTELTMLTHVLTSLLENEQKTNRQIQCVKMTVSEIKKCFMKENFPKSTFVQYN